MNSLVHEDDYNYFKYYVKGYNI